MCTWKTEKEMEDIDVKEMGCDVDKICSGSYPVADFDISSVEHSHFASIELVWSIFQLMMESVSFRWASFHTQMYLKLCLNG
jgi:hypothetical protein